jgi:hypothetical protein
METILGQMSQIYIFMPHFSQIRLHIVNTSTPKSLELTFLFSFHEWHAYVMVCVS